MSRIRLALAGFLVAVSLGASGGMALALGDDHNCAGTGTSGAAAALGPVFGDLVSDAAEAQVVDNFGAANCGETPRQNP